MLKHLSDLIYSPSLRENIGRAAQEQVIQNFSVERFVKEMSSVYDSVLEMRKKH
jgi:glycosyltransferase involved in cell wall biosynthesis